MEENIELAIKEDPDTKERRIANALSEDGMYYWTLGSEHYIFISCMLSGLPDNTQGTGRHAIDLRYPGGQVDDELLEGARRFNKAVQAAREELRREQEEAQEEEAQSNN